METRPVIIIGGGLWGSLLAFRLSECLPEVAFVLYGPMDKLGEDQSWTFHQSDLPASAMKWIKPFITKSWQSHQVEFPKFTKNISNPYHMIHSSAFEKVLTHSTHSKNIVRNNELDIEDALNEGRFVIDTRNFGTFNSKGFQKSLGFKFTLRHPHQLNSPITIDSKVPQLEGFRYLQYFPLSEREVLVRDVRHSSNPSFHTGSIKQEMIDEINKREWDVVSIEDQEFALNGVPENEVTVRSDGRVINLSGIFHDATGESLPDAVRLIDRMVKTSFRLGELKEIVKNYRREREVHRKYFRLLNKFIFNRSQTQKNYKIYEALYQMPFELRAKFFSGEIEFIDFCRTLLGLPPMFWGSLKLPKVLTVTEG